MTSNLSESTFSNVHFEWILGEIFFLVFLLFLFFFMLVRNMRKKLLLSRNTNTSHVINVLSPEETDISEFRVSLHYRIQSAKTIIHLKHASIRPLSQRVKTLRVYENSLFVHDKDLFIVLMNKSFNNLDERLSNFRINHEEFIYCSLVLLEIPQTEIKHVLQLTKSDLQDFENKLSNKFKINDSTSLKTFIFTFHPDYKINH